MLKEHKVDLDFGQVSLQRNSRSRNLRIKIHPEKGVVVSMPLGCSESRALDFVHRKQDWIIKTLNKANTIKGKFSQFSHESNFSTRYHQLAINQHSRSVLRFEVKADKLNVFYPEGVDVHNEKVQAFIRHAITETLRFEAKKYLPKRTEQLASKNGLSIGRVTVRDNKTRWGSCSGKNNISLNIHLMRLPDEMIDYVILHELAHIKVKNHSKGYWLYLESLLHGAKRLDKELNKYHLVYW